MNQLILDPSGNYTARIQENCPYKNASNRLIRFKALNYELFGDLIEDPLKEWTTCEKYLASESAPAVLCCCGHFVENYYLIGRSDVRAYIGVTCAKHLGDDLNIDYETKFNELAKKCNLCKMKKKKMTDKYCLSCEQRIKIQLIKKNVELKEKIKYDKIQDEINRVRKAKPSNLFFQSLEDQFKRTGLLSEKQYESLFNPKYPVITPLINPRITSHL